jgi:hypothetical protein
MEENKLYCFKCKEKRESLIGIEIKPKDTKKGKKFFKYGECAVCGTEMYQATKSPLSKNNPDEGAGVLQESPPSPLSSKERIMESITKSIVSFFSWIADKFGHSDRVKKRNKEEIIRLQKELEFIRTEKKKQTEEERESQLEVKRLLEETQAILKNTDSRDHFERVIKKLDETLQSIYDRLEDYIELTKGLKDKQGEGFEDLLEGIGELKEQISQIEVGEPRIKVDVEEEDNEIEIPPDEKEFSDLEPHEILGITKGTFAGLEAEEKIKRFFIVQGSLKYPELVKPLKSKDIGDFLNLSPKTITANMDGVHRYFGEFFEKYKAGQKTCYLLNKEWDFSKIAEQEAKKFIGIG